MPARKDSETHVFEGEGLTLKVTRKGRTVTMRVLEQDERLRSKHYALCVLASHRKAYLNSAGEPEIMGNVVWVRGTSKTCDENVAMRNCETVSAARALVRIIGKLVAKVRLPEEQSDE